jgi:hypothetical protein
LNVVAFFAVRPSAALLYVANAKYASYPTCTNFFDNSSTSSIVFTNFCFGLSSFFSPTTQYVPLEGSTADRNSFVVNIAVLARQKKDRAGVDGITLFGS